MSVQSLPIVLGLVAMICFCISASIYFALKKVQPVSAWLKRRLTALPRNQSSASSQIEAVLQSKRREDQTTISTSPLMKILETQMEEGDGRDSSSRPQLPKPPSHRVADALKRISGEELPGRSSGNSIENVIVKMYEDYLHEITDFQKQLSEAISVPEVLGKTCKAVSGFSRQARVVYLSYQASQQSLMVSSRSHTNVFAGTQPKMLLPTHNLGKSISVEELRSLFMVLPKDAELQRLLKDSCLVESRARAESNPDEVFAAQTPWRIHPFFVRGVPQGIFAIQESAVCHRREYPGLVEIFLTQAALSVENVRLHSKIVDVSAKDGVTGLQSRKVFHERLEESFLIARRLRHPLTVLRIDMDHMSPYVKQYGSSVSDALLRHVTRHLERHFRKSDIIARFGNDGFAIIMPHTALVDALKKVDAVLLAIRESTLRLGRQETAIEIKASVSAGVSEFPSHANSSADILRLANEALHRGQGTSRGSLSLAKVPTGYVPPFNSRFVRSAPKSSSELALEEAQDS